MDARNLFAYTVRLRWRLLDALRTAPPELLTGERHTNHHSILQTLIHIMAVEESWVSSDLQGKPDLSWAEFRARYLGDQESLEAVIAAWHTITDQTLAQLEREPDLQRVVAIPDERPITVEQIIYHLAGEEMIHMGEILAMTRQMGIDLPSYFLMSIMHADDRPYEEWVAQRNERPGT